MNAAKLSDMPLKKLSMLRFHCNQMIDMYAGNAPMQAEYRSQLSDVEKAIKLKKKESSG